AATLINGRLVVRRGGETLNAAVQPTASAADLVAPDPAFPLSAALSGDGHYIHARPDGFLKPGRRYSVRFHGDWSGHGAPPNDAAQSGAFDDRIEFKTEPAHLKRVPLHTSNDEVSALELSRLAVPLPTLLPSVNQIGFDGYDWIVGALRVSKPDAHGE